MQKEIENLVQAVWLLKVEPGFEPTQSGSLNLCAVLRLVAQSFLTLCDPRDCSPPGSSVHGIFQVRILEWAAISSSRDLLNPIIEPVSPAVSCIGAT